MVPVTLKQSDEGVAAWTTIQPQGNRRVLGVMAGLEKPEERVGCRRGIDIARIRLHARGRLADSLLARFFVADGRVVGRLDGFHTGRVLGHLATIELRRTRVDGLAGCDKR